MVVGKIICVFYRELDENLSSISRERRKGANQAIPSFSPDAPDGLQYEADRQTQLRAYAEKIPHYSNYGRRLLMAFFTVKSFPLFKYFPDHQLDIYPLLWSTTEAGIGDKKLLLKFKNGSLLPKADDKIVVSVDYYTDQADREIWFTLKVPQNTLIFSFQTIILSIHLSRRQESSP